MGFKNHEIGHDWAISLIGCGGQNKCKGKGIEIDNAPDMQEWIRKQVPSEGYNFSRRVSEFVK